MIEGTKDEGNPCSNCILKSDSNDSTMEFVYDKATDVFLKEVQIINMLQDIPNMNTDWISTVKQLTLKHGK